MISFKEILVKFSSNEDARLYIFSYEVETLRVLLEPNAPVTYLRHRIACLSAWCIEAWPEYSHWFLVDSFFDRCRHICWLIGQDPDAADIYPELRDIFQAYGIPLHPWVYEVELTQNLARVLGYSWLPDVDLNVETPDKITLLPRA